MIPRAVSQVDSIAVDETPIADTLQMPRAQERPVGRDEFGFRLGAGPHRSGEIAVTWHKALGRYRLETDLGWAQSDKWSYLNLSTAFHFRWHITKGLYWYIGPGVNMGWYFRDYHFGLGIGAQLGIEYNLPFPLQLSLDIFPRWNIIGTTESVGFGGSGGLSIRYRF